VPPSPAIPNSGDISGETAEDSQTLWRSTAVRLTNKFVSDPERYALRLLGNRPVNPLDRITFYPHGAGGQPFIRGTRVAVGTIVGLVSKRRTRQEILADYPNLESDDISAALSYAAQQRDMALANLDLSPDKLEVFCRKWRVQELSLFGSVLRDDFGPDSDVDVLVSFAEDAPWSLWDFTIMRDELSAVVGRPVDLVEREGLRNPFRRHTILETRKVIYRGGAG